MFEDSFDVDGELVVRVNAVAEQRLLGRRDLHQGGCGYHCNGRSDAPQPEDVYGELRHYCGRAPLMMCMAQVVYEELEIGETIGRGASSVVLRGMHIPTGTLLALKVSNDFTRASLSVVNHTSCSGYQYA